jgi:hypothetical protein
MARLFTFGCSFTQYLWPTWANIIGREFEFFENWGQAGLGNQFIFNSVVECNLQHTLTPNDTVIIMWSDVARDDRYVNRNWQSVEQSLSREDHKKYFKEFIEKFADIRGYYIRDLATIWATHQILKSINCRYIFLSMTSLNKPPSRLKESADYHDLLEKYQSVLSLIRPSVHQVMYNQAWTSLRPKPIIINHTQSKERVINKEWKQFYPKIKDSTWPAIPNYADFSKLPKDLQKECVDFGWDEGKLTKQASKSVDTKINLSHDFHPTPIEHLGYLDRIVPEITISDSTKNWVAELESRMKLGQPFYDELFFDEQLACRW